MAGSVIISNHSIWSASGVAFATIVSLMRERIGVSERFSEVFLPMEQGADFISLEELDRDSFRQFYQSLSNVLGEYERSMIALQKPIEAYSGNLEVWKELRDLLSRDERLDSAMA